MEIVKDIFGDNRWRYIKTLSLIIATTALAVLYSTQRLCINPKYVILYNNGHHLHLFELLTSLPLEDILGAKNSYFLTLNIRDAIILCILLAASFIFNTWPRAFFCKLLERQKQIIFSCNAAFSNSQKIQNFNIHCDFDLKSLMSLYALSWGLAQLTTAFCVFILFSMEFIPSIISHTEIYAFICFAFVSLLLIFFGEWIYHIKIFPRYIALMRVSGESIF